MICDSCGRGMMLARNQKYECSCGHIQANDGEDDFPSIEDEMKRIAAEGKEKKRTVDAMKSFQVTLCQTIDRLNKELADLAVRYKELKR